LAQLKLNRECWVSLYVNFLIDERSIMCVKLFKFKWTRLFNFHSFISKKFKLKQLRPPHNTKIHYLMMTVKISIAYWLPIGQSLFWNITRQLHILLWKGNNRLIIYHWLIIGSKRAWKNLVSDSLKDMKDIPKTLLWRSIRLKKKCKSKEEEFMTFSTFIKVWKLWKRLEKIIIVGRGWRKRLLPSIRYKIHPILQSPQKRKKNL